MILYLPKAQQKCIDYEKLSFCQDVLYCRFKAS